MKLHAFPRTAATLALVLMASWAAAKLPAPTPEAKAKADEAAAKAAWSDKVAAYKLCLTIDRVAQGYFKNAKAKGLETHPPTPTPPCSDPGPFASAGAASSSKPLEASEAHSPAATATSPPSSKATQGQLSGKK